MQIRRVWWERGGLSHTVAKTPGFSGMQPKTLPVTEFSEIYNFKKINSVIYLGIFSYR
jgi:hypothetical protein